MTGCLQWLDSLVFGGEHSIVKMAAGDAALSGSGSDPVCTHARWCRERTNMAASIKQQRVQELLICKRKYDINFKARGVLAGFCGFKWIRGYPVCCSAVVIHIVCVYQSSC